MQIVIDIPKEMYETIKDGTYCGSLYEELKNGILLPKGHGRLIDADALKEETYTMTEWNGDVHQIIYKASLDDAPTIIEADKEET